MEYSFKDIEEKWKKYWAENKVYKVTEDPAKPKFYILDMFPYPSGAGLHVGHPLGYVASDIYARYKKLKGFNVLHPMGFDAFGLPAEQYALETGQHPAKTTDNAIKRYREQLDKIGFSYDWERTVTTSDPKFYKWTQWIFLKLFNSWYNRSTKKAEGLETLVKRFETKGCENWPQHDKNDHPEFTAADWQSFSPAQQQKILMNYRLAFLSYAEVNWCPALGTVLANDEVKDGKSERGGHPVERKRMRQWFLRITEYSDRLLEGLDRIDWSESIKEMQRNWIGRSEGAQLFFKTDKDVSLEIFTTRPDTIFGATFMVIAPEHEMVEKFTTDAQKAEVDKYLEYVGGRTDVERQQEKKVTGVFTGSYAINPFNGTKIPIWIAEYVLIGYGTGAIMAVPADDERDHKFAEKFNLPIVDIIDKSMYPGATIEDKLGKMINSDFINGLEVKDAIQTMLGRIEEMGIGKRKVNYRQRDAGFSRQRYWGEPFPIKYNIVGEPDSHFEDVGEHNDIPIALSESELPLILPEVKSYKPSSDGRAPLANNEDWVKAGYETDTMPGYAGSSWYFLRYMDANNEKEFASKERLDYWQNVDLYLGGSEHAVGHLLYARFWHKFLFDTGYVQTDEPFKKLVNQGMITNVAPKLVLCKVGGVEYSVSVSKVNFAERTIQMNGATSKIDDGVLTLVRVPYKLVKHQGSEIRLYEVDWTVKKDDPDTLPLTRAVGSKPLWDLDNENNRYFTLFHEVEKMSKSKYNVVTPDDVIAKNGADCFRMFEMFLGPIELSKPWDDKGISGVSNFLRKFWRLFYDDAGNFKVVDETPTDAEYKALHKTLKKIAEDIERLAFNTCVSSFMICVNELGHLNCHKRKILEPLVIAIAPFAPFIAEEIWRNGFKNEGSIHNSSYPAVEEKYLVENSHEYPVSVNGKVRAHIALPLDTAEEAVKKLVLELENVKKWTNGGEPKKFIFVKGKIINVVV